MNFENTKRKIKAEKLPIWFLSIINARGVPQLIAKFTEEDIARSVKYLEEQVKFFSDEKDEVCFEIKAQSKLTSNGKNAELIWEFYVPPTRKLEDPNARLNGPYSGLDGLGALTHPFVQGQLTEISSEKRRLEERREMLLKDETRVMIQENDLKREKEYWDRERKAKEDEWVRLRTQKEEELKILKEKFEKRVEAGKEALSGFSENILPLLNDFFSSNPASGLSGANPKADTDEDKLINSIAFTIRKHKEDLSINDLQRIGEHVGKLIVRIKNEKEQEAEATA